MLHPADELGDEATWEVLKRQYSTFEGENERSLIGQWDACDTFDVYDRLPECSVPLHGVGFQGHLDFLPTALPGQVDLPTQAEMTATLQRFAALGVDVEITERTVHTWRLKGDRAPRLAQQRGLDRVEEIPGGGPGVRCV